MSELELAILDFIIETNPHSEAIYNFFGFDESWEDIEYALGTLLESDDVALINDRWIAL